MNIEHVVRDSRTIWSRAAPATPQELANLAAAFPNLPADYLLFLSLSNGGEGDLAYSPGWFQLWPANEIESLNLAYEVARFLPEHIAFGSSGGGEMFAFTKEGTVVAVPFIAMGAIEAVVIANTFADLAVAFGHEPTAL